MKSKDPFFVNAEKFVKMLEFVKQVRDAQKSYFKSRGDDTQSLLIKSNEIESKLDKALSYYLSNKEKINDVPF